MFSFYYNVHLCLLLCCDILFTVGTWRKYRFRFLYVRYEPQGGIYISYLASVAPIASCKYCLCSYHSFSQALRKNSSKQKEKRNNSVLIFFFIFESCLARIFILYDDQRSMVVQW